MYEFKGNGKKFKHYDLGDFEEFELPKRDVTFDLRKKHDQDYVNTMFRFSISDQTSKPKYRILDANQEILDNYLENVEDLTVNELKRKLFEDNEKLKPKVRNRGHVNLIDPYQTKLSDFKNGKYVSHVKHLKKGFYEIKPNKTEPSEIVLNTIPEDEICSIQNYMDSKGYLKDLFLVNGFTIFDELQIQHDLHVGSSNFGYGDVIKCEIARFKLGISEIRSFLTKLGSWCELQMDLGIFDKNIPTEKRYIELLLSIGENMIYKYFSELRYECLKCGLYGNKISIWDNKFYKVNLNGYTKIPENKNNYSDVSAYVKGNNLVGIGLLESNIVDSLYGLPLHYDTYTARTNDNISFRDMIKTYMTLGLPKPELIISDGGPRGLITNNLVLEYGVTPLIAGPSNAVGNIIKTPKGRIFYADYIDEKYWWILDILYDLRTYVERKFSLDIIFYKGRKIPTRLSALEKVYIGILNITHLLTALTAFKFGQLRLVRPACAFSKVYSRKETIRSIFSCQSSDAQIILMGSQNSNYDKIIV